ncbi:MAG: hypothetical protein ACR2G4_14465 [Pyrinomonadaceae bacterium]
MVEIVFVAALAVYFFHPTFNSPVRGSIEVADQQIIAGWAVNAAHPDIPVEVYLYIDGHVVSHQIANTRRITNVNSNLSIDAADHGFVFHTPALSPDTEHEARVYIMHATSDDTRRVLREIDEAKRFRVTAAQEKLWRTSVDQQGERRQ